MTIDERIQALTESLELLSHMHMDFEKKWTAIAFDMGDAVKRLTKIAEDHEKRITDLE